MRSSKEKNNLIKAARAGGKALRKYFGKTLNPVEKSTLWDFQTIADLESEKAILKVLKSSFPTYNIFSEEAGILDRGSEFTLIVDPLDGTNNFIMGIPNFSVSIGLLHKKEAVAGVVYQPILDQTYFAAKGRGAWLNGKQINVNDVIDRNKVTISYSCGYKTDRLYLASMIGNLMSHPHKRISLNWSMANDYCLLAAGKIEAMITDPGCPIYDFAAGKLIAIEAGAVVSDLSGKNEENYMNESFLLSNHQETHNYVLDIIKIK